MDGERATSTEHQRELLGKVLRLEVRKGYRDAAVSGGLARFARGVAAGLSTTDSELANDLLRLLGTYDGLTPADRQERVRRALGLLDGKRAALPAPPASRPKANGTQPAGPATTPRPRATRPSAPASLDDPVTVLPSVGPARARQLQSLGVTTVRDLLYLLPRRYEDYTRVQPIGSPLFHQTCTVVGTVTAIQSERTARGKTIVTAQIADQTGSIHAIWFNPYVARQLHPGTTVALSGRIEQQRGVQCFRNPEWEPLDRDMLHTGRIVPIYPLTRGLYQKQVRTLTRLALDAARLRLEDPLPDKLRARHQLLPLVEALEAIHYPSSEDAQREARRRLAFDEFLVMQLGLVRRKVAWQAETGHAFPLQQEVLDRFAASLPFRLTAAQSRALNEILADMADTKPMSRLLQGDVGSGKTAVAAAAALVAIADGYQVAVLAPTEILAEQHARNLAGLYAALPEADRPCIGLLTGRTPASERTILDERLRSGTIDLLVGTHAILERPVSFKRLGLAVIDEQHRFGVAQRARLREKGFNPDILVMTATPIPRSLALVIHGDLDVSIIDELPPGRQPVETSWITADRRADAYRFVRREIDAGHQAFIIYPLVEESESIDARAATVEYERLARDVFPDLRLGLLHGRLRSAEKDAVMTGFRDGEIDILVSTSVVEVGIDVPNATVMLIEGANRFGLAQLHQFRGRVGRGAARSYCVLITDDQGDDSRQRLEALVDTQDGFRLAEIDLELRGPGEFFGTRQSGLPDLKLASLGDLATLQQAREEAQSILADDPTLSDPRHRVLAEHVRRFWKPGAGDIS